MNAFIKNYCKQGDLMGFECFEGPPDVPNLRYHLIHSHVCLCVCAASSQVPSNWACCKPTYRQVVGDTFLVSSYEVFRNQVRKDTKRDSKRDSKRDHVEPCRLKCKSVASVFVCVCVCARASCLEDRRFSFAVILFRSHNMS